MEPSSLSVTQLLERWSDGQRDALDRLVPLVHRELRQMAARYLRRERPDHTLQATALVNEAYIKLIDQRRVQWRNRAHFFGVAAQLMRRILVDHARARAAVKREAGERVLSLDEALLVGGTPDVTMLALDEALARLASLDPQQSRVVELKFFGGMTIDEIAEVLGISAATVSRDWTMARAWLYAELQDSARGQQ
ncbi:MAG TPA: sigma-70 family RNA polymerase sigma factor [Vicinamibacterales bacterium]|nr:sigma-70 family RNA polymerase sigma factor [Vicinamibacterales bacterium]